MSPLVWAVARDGEPVVEVNGRLSSHATASPVVATVVVLIDVLSSYMVAVRLLTLMSSSYLRQ